MAFVAPNQGYGSPVFNPTQAPYPSSNPINPRLLLIHQLLRSPDGNTYNHPNFGFHHFPGQLITAQPGGTVPAPGRMPNPGLGHLPTPVPIPATGIAPPSEPGGVPGPTPNDPRTQVHLLPAYPDGGGGATPDSLAAVQALQDQDSLAAAQALQDQVNAQPHPAVNANIAAVQAAHEQARALAAHIANRRVLRPVRLRRGRQVM